jgi:hypothetical protein
MTVRPEQFAALVTRLAAEMKAMTTDQFAAVTFRPALPASRDAYEHPSRQADPDAFAGCPWVTERVTIEEAVTLTGHTRGTLVEYSRRANLARYEGKELLSLPPALARDDTWETGELAIWKAVQKSELLRQRRDGINYDLWLPAVRKIVAEHDARGEEIGKRKLRKELDYRIGETTCYYLLKALGRYEGRPEDRELIAFARKEVARAAAERRPFYAAALRDAFHGQGWYHLGTREARRILREAAGYDLKAMELLVDSDEIVYPGGGGEGVPVRDLVFAQQVKDACHVGPAGLTDAVKARRLTCYRWKPAGSNVEYLMFHPERIELIPGYATPVDKGWRPPEKTDGRVAANRKRATAERNSIRT